MSLIKCPECQNTISDKSEVCIHCGFPLSKINQEYIDNLCLINGTKYDLDFVLQTVCMPDMTVDDMVNAVKKIAKTTNLFDSLELFSLIEETKQIPKEFNGETIEEHWEKNPTSSKPKCPTCGSTNISKIGSGERMASVLTLGIMSKKINKSFKCNNCKYSW